MEVKLAITVLIAMTLVVNTVVADFYFNHPSPKAEDILDSSRYTCVPGRTIIKVTEKQAPIAAQVESDSEEFRLRKGPTRKKHMTVPTQDEYCRICVCSADGRDEYCSNRPAENTNECLMMRDITYDFKMGLPYEHTRSLANRIRRDYIWHNDEIPYSAKAKCYRGHSYYTNSITANDTDIDIGSDVESLLDYDNEFTCYYCVCSTDGESIGCINRDVSFCNFYRVIRSDKHVRDRYTSLMEQDRPAYFRQLSYRLRRTMDNGLYDMLNAVNDVDNVKKKCVPFISEYTDCNDENLCSGCSHCTCNGDGEWNCQDVKKCPEDDNSRGEALQDDDYIFDNALEMLESAMKKKKRPQPRVLATSPNVPAPQAMSEDLLAPFHNDDVGDAIHVLSLSRSRRSIDNKNKKHTTKRSADKPRSTSRSSSLNDTSKYYTIDEINEDTLKDSNITGTLVAKKIDVKPHIGSRRTEHADPATKALQIEYNHPKTYNQITDNKIEAIEQESKFDSSHENLKTVLGNYTQNTKDNELSKIVVNELKKGNETIGDTSAVPVSNITFIPENDTLTAMTFIAGNLLNKLWNMEKEATASSIETDGLKHEKISDLLELFKEPLNMRQEIFLKNALEQLSAAVNMNKDVKNISICETINESEQLLQNATRVSDEETTAKAPCRKNVPEDANKPTQKTQEGIETKEKVSKEDMEIKRKEVTIKAIRKINNVLELIKKFEYIQGNISELQHGPRLVFNHTSFNNKNHETGLSNDDENSFNIFGNLLEKITKLLLPKRNHKKIGNAIKSQNFLKNNENLKTKFKKMYNVDLTNMTVSAKDKIILDYLTHVDKNPDCLLKSKYPVVEAIPSVEGNILLNLSEFFKLKSFSDLIKLLGPEKAKSPESPVEKEIQRGETTTKETAKKEIQSSIKDVDTYKFSSTKDKLKVHLKAIIEDLLEIQSAKGVNFKSNFKVSDALPCIYNLLKADREVDTTEEKIDPVKKIANIFQEIKKEIKVSMSRRNSGDIMSERPKSVVVWERLVKNLISKTNLNTRRLSKSKIPKSYEEIKKMMERIENGSSTYKHHALLVKVPAAGKLILLKALEQDVQATIKIIDEITLSLDSLTKLPTEQFAELEEFVDNMVTSLNLSEKVNKKVKPDLRKLFVAEINAKNTVLKTKLNKNPILRNSDPRTEESEEMKINRIQIVNQIIRNRMEMFLKLKQDSGSNVKNDMNYNIAQKILYYLDTGNYKLASELFKWFVMQKKNEPASDQYIVPSTPNPMRRNAQDSTVLLEDPSKIKAKQLDWISQDHLIKQLLNIKHMGL